MAITNNTYLNQQNPNTNWNEILNALPQDERGAYKLKNIAQVNRQYVGTPMFRELNIDIGTTSPIEGHPWANSTVGTANLVGRWMLNEGSGNTAYDSSGNGDDGVWSGTASGANGTYYSAGITSAFAGTFSADGTTFVTLTPPAELAGNANKSMTLWFNCSSVSGSEQDIAEFGTDTAGETFGIGLNNGGEIFGHLAGSPDFFSGIVATANTWYFAAITYDNSTNDIDLYVNGNVAATQNYVLNTVMTNFFFGQHLDNPSCFFPGLIDDVRIYNITLSSSNISDIYNGLA